MTLRYIILTNLIKAEATGYDITKKFKEEVGVFWKASHQQVYRELNKMESQGLVEHYLVKQDSKPDKKIYKITESGRESLYEWLDEGKLDVPQTRDAISARLMAARKKDLPKIKNSIEELINEISERVKMIQEIRESLENAKMKPHERLITDLTIERIELQYQATLEWCSKAIKALK